MGARDVIRQSAWRRELFVFALDVAPLDPFQGKFMKKSGRLKFLTSLVRASLLASVAHPALAQEADVAAQGDIVVTAQRRAQNTQAIPYNISAVSGSDLEKTGTAGINDLTKNVAGLLTIDTGPATRGGNNDITLRGLRTESPSSGGTPSQTVNSVSTYFGDTPVFFPMVFKDIDRIEVLRGPQGTLYGSGAEAGTIRVIPNRPIFSKTTAELNVTGSATEHSRKRSGGMDGVVNLPISSNLALRVVAGYDHLGGFIDAVDRFELDADGAPLLSNPGDLTSAPVIGSVKRDTNSSTQWFARAALRFNPTDQLDFEITYLHQKTAVDDVQTSNPLYSGGVVDLSAGTYATAAYDTRPGGKLLSTDELAQPYRNNVDLVSGTATIDLGLASFTSTSSYVDNKTTDHSNNAGVYSIPVNFLPSYGSFPRFTAPTTNAIRDKSFIQELRFVSTWDKPFSFVGGVYYEHNTKDYLLSQYGPGLAAFSAASGIGSANPQLGDLLATISRGFKFIDRAAFGELTWSITKSWQITGGVRYFWQKFSNDFYQQFPFCGEICGDGFSEPVGLGSSDANISKKFSDHIVKLNTSYDVSSTLKVYATYAEGFRRGGANGISTSGYFASLLSAQTYEPDLAKNYEIGVKGSLLDRRLRFSFDVFRIDLNKFQFNGSTPSFLSAVYNGNKARSEGVEAEVSAKIDRHTLLALGYSYTDAKVRKGVTVLDLPPYAVLDPNFPDVPLVVATTVPSGARLPGVPRHSITATLSRNVPLNAGNSLTFYVNGSYRTSSPVMIDETDPAYFILPATFNGSARISYDSGHGWGADLFVNNFTDSAGYSSGSSVANSTNIFATRAVSRPRTWGLNGHYSF